MRRDDGDDFRRPRNRANGDARRRRGLSGNGEARTRDGDIRRYVDVPAGLENDDPRAEAVSAARNDPVPESFRFVTRSTAGLLPQP